MSCYHLSISGFSNGIIISSFNEKDDFDAFIHAKGFLSGLLFSEGSVPDSLTADLRTEGAAPALARCAVSAQDGLREPIWTFTPRSRSKRPSDRNFSVPNPHDEGPMRFVASSSKLVRKKSSAARG